MTIRRFESLRFPSEVEPFESLRVAPSELRGDMPRIMPSRVEA